MRVDPQDVQRLIAQNASRHSRAEMLGHPVLHHIVTFISKDRSYYLAFGPYWWVLKDIIRRHVGGPKLIPWMGDSDDLDIRRRYQTGDDLYDLNACLLYQADHSGNRADAPQRHDVDDGGEDTISYDLSDPDMHRE